MKKIISIIKKQYYRNKSQNRQFRIIKDVITAKTTCKTLKELIRIDIVNNKSYKLLMTT